MANAYVNVDWIAAESLMVLSDALVIGPLTAKDKTADFMVTPNGYKVGDTVRIKTGPAYTAKEFTAGGTVDVQDVRSSNRNMTIEKHLDVTVEIGAKEQNLNFEGFSEEVIQPAAIELAEKVDNYLGTKILNGHGLYSSDNLFGTAADVALARKEAKYQQLSMNRFCLTDDTLEAKLLGQEWFNQSQTRGGPGVTTLQSGFMGRVMGMDFAASTQFTSSQHTAGTGTGTTDNGGGANNLVGDKILVTTGGAGTVTVGDFVKIAGVRRALRVATANANLATTPNIELIDPITEIIPDGAAITVISSGNTFTFQGAIFDDKSMGLAMPLLDPPSDKPSSVISSDGYSIRVVQGYDMQRKVEVMSLDLLVGAEAYDPRRITLLSEF